MAFSYNKKNLANTTITGAITSSDTSITVDDATVFPSGYFYATLMPSSEMSTFSNSEIVLVTNISSNTLTIARGQKNTTARAFSAGAIITNGVYTEDLDFAQSVGKKIFNATWGGQSSPYYKITDDMLKVVPDEGTSIRAIFDTDYTGGTANLSINENASGVATVSGSNISITDAENLAPLDVKFKGDTFQQTYSGINTAFLNQSLNTNYSSSNWTYTSDTGEDVTATKVSGGGKFFATFEANVVSGHTYRIKATVGASSGTIQIYLYKDQTWGTSAGGRAYIGTGNVDVQITPDYTGKMVLGVFSDGAVNDTVYCNDFMFGENVQSSSSYEPYVGGTASPNPDYPQEVQTVTGEQTITISDGGSQSQSYTINLTGKNLFDKATAQTYKWLQYPNGLVVDSADPNVVGDLLHVTVGETYVISGIGGLQFNLYTYTDSSFSNPVRAIPNSTTIRTFTATTEWLRFSIGGGDAVSIIDNIQFEKGSTATDYQAFLHIELCKIGTYQDYIYKSGDDWYVHKELGKKSFNGSETWYQETASGLFRCTTPISDIVSSSGRNISGLISNSFIPTIDNVVGGIFYGNSYLVLYPQSSITTLNDFKTWLMANSLIVYYPLATATDTQITDSTLISQLNALSEVTLNAGTNNIVVTGGLDGILEVQYYVSGSGVNLVPIVNGAYVADDNTRNVAPVKAGIPYDLTYHNGNWYVMNMSKKITSDDVDFTAYTTTEQVVGTWIDGKPIYRKIVTYTNTSTIGQTGSTVNIPIPHNILNIAEVMSSVGYRVSGDNGETFPLPQIGGSGSPTLCTILRAIDRTNIYLRIINDTWAAGNTWRFIIKYTKTTD